MRRLNGSWVYVIAGFLILSVTGCAHLADALPDIVGDREPDRETVLVNTEWLLKSYGGSGDETAVLDETEVTLRFEEAGRAGGSGGCNTFGAQYVISNGSISFTEVEATAIACPGEGVMEQEQAYFQALRTAGEFELAEDALRIWYADGAGALNFVEDSQG